MFLMRANHPLLPIPATSLNLWALLYRRAVVLHQAALLPSIRPWYSSFCRMLRLYNRLHTVRLAIIPRHNIRSWLH